jgi:hypothetical protein
LAIARMKITGIQIVAFAVLAAAVSSAAAAAASDTETVLPTVTVGAMRDPVDKSYRRMIRGMDLFERMRALAPQATLRYKLLPRQRDTSMNGITMSILSDNVSIPVHVSAADHSFTLERNQKALEENASVIPNRRAGSMTWRTDIRTPGLPPGTRRLGDLRLECLVGMEAGLISDESPVFGALANFIQGGDYCNRTQVRYLFFTERPLFTVTLVSGDRREVLSVDQMYAGLSNGTSKASELAYCDCQVLLGDKRWPDDTLIEFEYMDEDARSAAVPSDTGGAVGAGGAPGIPGSAKQ